MMPAVRPSHLIERMPPARGRLAADAPIGPFTWFRVGGPAEVLFRPADEDDLASFLAALDPAVPVTVIGAGSNLIVRDGGVPGVVVRLARGFGTIAVEPDGLIAGAAALDVTVAETAAAAGLDGLAFLSGIPGSVGGAVAMNAGAYGVEVKDVLDGSVVVTRGRAQVSEKHCNFLLNLGGATAAEIEGLGEEVRRRVHAATGVTLEWEIRRIGIPAGGLAEVTR